MRERSLISTLLAISMKVSATPTAPEKDLELSTIRTVQATRVSGGKVYATDTVFILKSQTLANWNFLLAIAVNGLLT